MARKIFIVLFTALAIMSAILAIHGIWVHNWTEVGHDAGKAVMCLLVATLDYQVMLAEREITRLRDKE